MAEQKPTEQEYVVMLNFRDGFFRARRGGETVLIACGRGTPAVLMEVTLQEAKQIAEALRQICSMRKPPSKPLRASELEHWRFTSGRRIYFSDQAQLYQGVGKDFEIDGLVSADELLEAALIVEHFKESGRFEPDPG